MKPSPTMPNVLACTDGSAYAASVYDHAAWAAQKLGASIHVLHLIDPHHETASSSDLTGTIGLGAKSALMEELVQLEAAKARLAHVRGRALLDEAREHLAKAGIAQVVSDQKHGSLADSIETYEREADLVVLGKRGENTSLDFKHLGSNLERVVRTCRHPVLVTARAFKPVNRVLFAYDGGPSAQRAVEFLSQRPLLKGVSLRLLTVGAPDTRSSGGLSAAREKLAGAGIDVSVENRAGHPEEVIADVVRKDSIDLLVMGAYGHTRIRSLIIGSTTSTLLRTCSVSALLFR